MTLLGSFVSYQAYFPDRETEFGVMGKALVSEDTVEFRNTKRFATTSNWINERIDFTADTIKYRVKDAGGSFADTSFNGIVLSDVDGTIPPIVGFRLKSNTLEIPRSDITFTEDSIIIDLAGLRFTRGEGFDIRVKFGQVPEVPSFSNAVLTLSDDPFFI